MMENPYKPNKNVFENFFTSGVCWEACCCKDFNPNLWRYLLFKLQGFKRVSFGKCVIVFFGRIDVIRCAVVSVAAKSK